MSFFKPRFLLLALGCALAAMTLGSGCGGDAFTPSTRAAAGGTSGESTDVSDSAGAEQAPGRACKGPEECDDDDSCTTDLCGADGVCATARKCLGTQSCCDGDCAECCGDADCDDGVSCTENTCFMGQCMYVPKDSRCETGEFCSSKHDCRPRQRCGILTGEDPLKVCDDDDGCTTDACGPNNFCQHDYCSKLCCQAATSGATAACASECCSDSQCDSVKDPCKVGSCTEGQCSTKSLCADGQLCCPSADGKSATCGACCTALDCDDHHGCTEDACSGGQCSNTPKNCDSEKCDDASDCKPSTPCQSNPRCVSGLCDFDRCAEGTKCCKETGCAACCSNEECDDQVACTEDLCTESGCSHTPKAGSCGRNQLCDPERGCVACLDDQGCDDGLSCTTDACSPQNSCTHTSTCPKSKFCTSAGCVECIDHSDCQGKLMTAAISLPGCTVQRCVSGTCQAKTETCDIGFCCPPYGCLQQQCVQTQ